MSEGKGLAGTILPSLLERKIIFQTSTFFRFHVNFPGCRCIPHRWALTFLNRKEVEVAAAHPADHWGMAVTADVPVMHHWGSVVLGVTWRKNSASRRVPMVGLTSDKYQLERNLNTWELKDLYKLKGRASHNFTLFHDGIRVGFRIVVWTNELNVAVGNSQKAFLNEETQKIRDLSTDSDYAR